MSIGYKPAFALPLIAPPPESFTGDPAAHYAALNTTATAVPVAGSQREALEITLTTSAEPTVYAISGGYLQFYAEGKVIDTTPDGQKAPLGGAWVLTVWPADFQTLRRKLPAGTDAIAAYIYIGIEDATLPIEDAVKLERKTVLEQLWRTLQNTTTVPNDLETLRDHYTAAVMQGLATVFVTGGTVIGKASGGKLQLQQLDGNTPRKYVSPSISLRANAQTDAAAPKGRWNGHPLLAAMANLPMPVEFHLRFTVWNPVTNSYVPISAEEVRVVQAKSTGDAPIATGTTDHNGVVHLSYPDLTQLAANERKLHFGIGLQKSKLFFDYKTGALKHFPPELSHWSTKGWLSADGLTAGSYDDFVGQTIGTNGKPVEFRVGVDFHVHFRRFDFGTGDELQFPPHVHVLAYVNSDDGRSIDLETDEHGDVEGILYGIPDSAANQVLPFPNPEKDRLLLALPYASVRIDNGIVTRQVASEFEPIFENVEKAFPFAINRLPSPTASVSSRFASIALTKRLKSDAIHVLQCIEETRSFFQSMTDSVDDLAPIWNPDLKPPGLRIKYLPVGSAESSGMLQALPYRIEFNRSDLDFRRDQVIFHELFHCVHLAVTNVQFSKDGPKSHHTRLFTNERFALEEGMAEFWAGLFKHPEWIFYLFPDLEHPDSAKPDFHWSDPFRGIDPADIANLPKDLNYIKRAPVPPFGDPTPTGPPVSVPFWPFVEELGYSVEGAFATAVYLVFHEHVVKRVNVDDPITVARTKGNGNVSSANAWMTADVRERFMEMIWKPFVSLKDSAVDSTRVYIDALETQILASFPSLWPAVKGTLNKMQISMTALAFEKLLRQGVDLTSVQSMIAYPDVQIAGKGFVDGIQIEFFNTQHSVEASTIFIPNTEEMFITLPPLHVGTYSLRLTTLSGTVVKPDVLTAVL